MNKANKCPKCFIQDIRYYCVYLILVLLLSDLCSYECMVDRIYDLFGVNSVVIYIGVSHYYDRNSVPRCCCVAHAYVG